VEVELQDIQAQAAREHEGKELQAHLLPQQGFPAQQEQAAAPAVEVRVLEAM
jgi:hypothetical protein